MTEISVTQLCPRLVVADADRAIAFYARALGAEETMRYAGADGTIAHAEITVGGFVVAVKDESEDDPSPVSLGGTPVQIGLRVTDADAVARAMTAAGATVVIPIADRPYGQRDGRLVDPFGHVWVLSQRL